jgi:hypothetical protein
MALTVSVSLVSNNQAANTTRIRLVAVAADNDTSRGGFGTAGWALSLNGSGVGGNTLSYDFGVQGVSYLLQSAEYEIGHNATGNATVSSVLDFVSNNSLIRPSPVRAEISSFALTPYPVLNTVTIPSSGSVGTAYTGSIAAHNAVSYSVIASPNNLPTGLTLNTTTGAITGTPTVPGVFTFTLRATGPTGAGVPTGFSVTTATQTVTILGGGRVWNGTAFVAGTTRVWNGSSWVSSTTRVWNGSAWVSST